MFSGYDSTEIVAHADIKPMPETKKRAMELTEEEAEKDRKRKKNDKKADTKQVKQKEQGDRQKSWQSFAKKSTKKGVVIPGLSGEWLPFTTWRRGNLSIQLTSFNMDQVNLSSDLRRISTPTREVSCLPASNVFDAAMTNVP